MGTLGQLEKPGEDAPGVSGGSGQALEEVREEFKVKYKSNIVHISRSISSSLYLWEACLCRRILAGREKAIDRAVHFQLREKVRCP